MKFFSVILLHLLTLSLGFSQRDSLQNKKREISTGTPMFPFLYNSIGGGLGIGKELINAPTLCTSIMGSHLFAPVNISYRIRINEKNKITFGIDATKIPQHYSKDEFYYLAHIGLHHRLNKFRNQIDTYFTCGLSVGKLQFGLYGDTGGNHNIGTIENGNVDLGAGNLGICMQLFLSNRVFIESEILLMAYYGNGNGFVYDSSYPDSKRPIYYNTYGLALEKFMGVNLGYKF